MTTIAINGFGRIGRLAFRQLLDRKDLKVVAINDLGDIENLAYLLKYDTIYGHLKESVGVKKGTLDVGGNTIQVFSEKDPAKLPWAKLKIDIVIEATGAFTSYEKAKAHIQDAGAKRVVITAPSKEENSEKGKTILVGVNEAELSTCQISSNGSCTTNAASPIMQILGENPGIVKAVLSTTHGYTATQNIVDGPSRNMRKGRAAAQNIIPSTTGAAIAIAKALPQFKDKFDGMALRVPVAVGSIADITFIAKKRTSVKEINSILTKAANLPKWKGIFRVTNDPIVSSDIIGDTCGAIADLSFTKVVDGDLVKVLSWYDNEWGYVSVLLEHVTLAAKTIK